MHRDDKNYFKCDEGHELKFIEIDEELDRYDDLVLCMALYECLECEEEYYLNVEMSLSEFDNLNKKD